MKRKWRDERKERKGGSGGREEGGGGLAVRIVAGHSICLRFVAAYVFKSELRRPIFFQSANQDVEGKI